MEDVIKLLTDRLANQIAAGEVIQRPASVIKELLENAIDAQASEITVIIKDAGKELIQVIDNGKGMSPMDARMCFERHATSKISSSDDLFNIQTMGFRGEAMASIGAVAQVEMNTKPENEDAGTKIILEGGVHKLQEVTACAKGTNIAVKNLFYNVPARRKFLKSNTTEWRHILDEFTRIAMAYPHISFKLYNGTTEQFHLRATSLKARIVDLLGNRFEKTLIQVQEDTDYLQITGFVGKPEAAIKTRGNQFFFVNNRYIRSPYLHHAVSNAYQDLIEKDAHPFYVLFFVIDPKCVDVNVHPTKQEVKFEDDQIMYSFLLAAVKHALARFNIAPSLDFSLDPVTQSLPSINLPANNNDIKKAAEGYLSHTFSKGGSAYFIEKKDNRQIWQQEKDKFFEKHDFHTDSNLPGNIQSSPKQPLFLTEQQNSIQENFMPWNDYLIAGTHNGLLIIHIKRALQRITFDELMQQYETNCATSQRLLFPEIMEFSPSDIIIITDLKDNLQRLGFEISLMGGNTIAVQGMPIQLTMCNVKDVFENIVEDAKNNKTQKELSSWQKIAMVAVSHASFDWKFSNDTAQALLGKLFSSSQPSYTPNAALIIKKMNKDELDAFF